MGIHCPIDFPEKIKMCGNFQQTKFWQISWDPFQHFSFENCPNLVTIFLKCWGKKWVKNIPSNPPPFVQVRMARAWTAARNVLWRRCSSASVGCWEKTKHPSIYDQFDELVDTFQHSCTPCMNESQFKKKHLLQNILKRKTLSVIYVVFYKN